MGHARDLGVPEDPDLTTDQRIAIVATRQFGVIEHEQLILCGLSRGGIKRRATNGSLRRRYPGVFSVGHDALSEDGELAAAVLACGEGAVLDGFSTARRWGLGTLPAYPIEVTVDAAVRTNAPNVRGVRTRIAALAPQDIRQRGRLPVMSLSRTMLALARRLELPELTKAFQKAKRKGLTLAQLDDVIERNAGRPGTPRLRKLVERQRGQRGFTRGGFEDVVYAWFDDWLPSGFQRPDVNVRTGRNGERESDLIFREHRLLVELDFSGHHGRDPVQWTRDTRRDRRSLLVDLRTIRITSDEFEDDPDAIRADFEVLLGLTPG